MEIASNFWLPDGFCKPIALDVVKDPATVDATFGQKSAKKRFCHDGIWGEYEGEFNSSGQRHGQGVMKWEDGDEYEGGWKDDMMEGRGTYRSAKGHAYEGSYKDDKRDGWGRYQWAGGDVYEGEIKDDVWEGWGTYQWANGRSYTGQFKGGKRTGRGMFRWSDGSARVCHWESGKAVGEGARWSADGTIAWRLDGKSKVEEISLQEARSIADRIGLPVPVARQ